MTFDIRSEGLWTRYAIQMRWAIIVGAALLMSDMFRSPLALTGLTFWAATNVALVLMLNLRSAKEEQTSRLAQALRFADGLAITGLGFVGGLHDQRLWLLGVPVLLSDAMASRGRVRVFALAGAMIAIQVAVELAAKSTPMQALPSVGTLAASAVIGVVLSGFRMREDRLAMRDRRLATVLECGAAFGVTRELRATILHTLKAAVSETGASCGYVMLSEIEGLGPLLTETAYSPDGEFQFPETLDYGFGLSGYVAKMGQPIAVSDESEEHKGFDGVTSGVHSAISVPLVTRGSGSAGKAAEEQVLGVLTLLCTRKYHTFTSEDMDLLRTLGSLIAVAVSNSRLEERQHSTFVRTMESLATALEARDEYTQGHSQRVCEVSMMLGEKMGFSSEAIEELRIGTVLHDIGKIGVPDGILNKRGRLTAEEFQVMKQHPVIGYEICKPLMLSEGVLMIIRNHHEKLDGSGYPDGLKGGELPLSLRIVCVADAFDAMSSTRPYRKVMAIREVLAELSRGAGTQFDSVVVEALKELIVAERLRALYHRNWAEADFLQVESPDEERKAA